MEQIELNLSGCATREELHSRIRDALDFPPYYGMNLDALFDMLTTESRPLRLVVCDNAALENERLQVIYREQ